jgi:hypothetical protein
VITKYLKCSVTPLQKVAIFAQRLSHFWKDKERIDRRYYLASVQGATSLGDFMESQSEWKNRDLKMKQDWHIVLLPHPGEKPNSDSFGWFRYNLIYEIR